MLCNFHLLTKQYNYKCGTKMCSIEITSFKYFVIKYFYSDLKKISLCI